ncbi:MAG TPA: N-succinylarginine dihydrolase [Polyangiaceae bacterium]|nr:N-succinylarginine dihydrolase [Polyangiaceae bacterium]
MSRTTLRELQLDGLVGPTHNYAGIAPGNTASDRHRGQASRPRDAALEGLAKMRLVHRLGVPQGVMPPHDRPSLATLRAWGFAGRDEEVLSRAASVDGGWLLRLAASASSMWVANAATVAPSTDTLDGRTHFVVANLAAAAHRSLEAPLTERILRCLFADTSHFLVHAALPGGPSLGDEGAANHTRLETDRGAVHVLGWGRSEDDKPSQRPARYPARQSREGSYAVARLLRLPDERVVFARQHPAGIDAGSFHTDVLAVGQGGFLLAHEYAFEDAPGLFERLAARLGPAFRARLVNEGELPVEVAVRTYPFNSQLLTLPSGKLGIVAPAECQAEPACKQLFDALVGEDGPVERVVYVDVRQSMQNGGGPACLRLRVPLTPEELGALAGRTLVNDALLDELEAWVKRHYREELRAADLADPALARESMAALDELTSILHLGPIYDFQGPAVAGG